MTFFPTGSRDTEPPSADKHETSQLQTKPCSDLGTQEQASGAFKHVPEGGLQDSSQAESIQASQEILCAGIARPTPGENKHQSSRSLLRLRRRPKARVSGGSVRDVPLSSTGETLTNRMASTGELQSPVFRQSSISATEETAPRAAGPALVQREENGFTPPSAASGDTEGSVPPGAPELFPCAPQDSSSVWQPRSPGAVPSSDNPEPAWLCSENRDAALVDISGDGGKESPSIISQAVGESMCEDQGELRGLLDLMSENEALSPDGNKTVTNESKSQEGNQSDISSLDPFPTDLALDGAGELLENQQLETQSRLSPLENVAAPGSALSSCTVVEGLLFPVEYYVRTTRRMSSCQRKVDLDAVILSQLSRSKKGRRSKCKLRDANSDQPSQEGAENDLGSGIVPFPCLGAENDPANSGSPWGSLPASSGTCRAELLPAINVPLRRSLRCAARQRAGGHIAKGPEGPAALGLPAVDLDTCGSLFSFRSLQWLAPKLDIRDFHLPDEEFGLLKHEKLESSPVNDLEVFVPSVFGDEVAAKDAQDAQMTLEEKCLRSDLISPIKSGLPKSPHAEIPASKKELSTHELLFTPMGTVLAAAPTQPGSQISSCVFPVVGATPAALPSVHSEVSPDTSCIPLSLRPSNGASVRGVQDGGCKDSAIPLHLDHCGEKAVAEQLIPVLPDGLREENLQLLSKLKDCLSSCTVDVSTMWWEAAGCRKLCVVTACESSVSLWKPLGPDHWEKVYTWQLGEIPVIQIVPLPDSCNLVCVALGDLEIGEIRLLLYSSENDSFRQSLVRTGNIKAVLGLKDRRLVSNSRAVQEQHVEVVSFSETGRSKDGQTLMPPEETVSAFAEVEGMRDALVGTTAVNSIVIWNLKTGQLLKKMHIGYSYPASVCHRAYSDSGLLFVVLSHPHAKESESCGNPAFRVVAFNPSTARSRGVMASSLPPRHTGRYLEGDVRGALAAAVLTSGAVAVWDLLLGQCTALLPPGPAGSWALARWATTDACTSACLLAGQQDGTICLYRYLQPQPGAA
uniref:Partner and localizer of BRCA2 n=1 Tax=Amazona collaria TaxID=241587 RepID=A0A8B9FJX9_9PSIT